MSLLLELHRLQNHVEYVTEKNKVNLKKNKGLILPDIIVDVKYNI